MTNIGKKVDALPSRTVVQETTPLKVEVQKKKNNTGTLIIAIIVILGCLALFQDDIRNLLPEEIEEIISDIEPADIQLYQFNDLASNESVNVEIWVMNIGEQTATDMEVYVRCRNQNGTILLSEEISLTALLLRENETCSGVYTISAVNNTKIHHTIEISWTEGRIAYNKTTILD